MAYVQFYATLYLLVFAVVEASDIMKYNSVFEGEAVHLDELFGGGGIIEVYMWMSVFAMNIYLNYSMKYIIRKELKITLECQDPQYLAELV